MKAIFNNNQDMESIHKVAKLLNEKEVVIVDADPESIRELMQQAGNKIASVHFIRRSNNELRKMCYRLHVSQPTFANAPKGKKTANRKAIDNNNNQITVFDVNKVLRSNTGEILKDENGKQKRGDWRTVPLENVTRVKIDGIAYTIRNK